MRKLTKKIKFSTISSGISLALLFCHALLLTFTPNLWQIAVYSILVLSIVNILFLLLTFREIRSLPIRKVYAIFVLLTMLLVSIVHTIISFQALAQGLQTYSGTCQTRTQSIRSYEQLITSDGKSYSTMNSEIIQTLKNLNGIPIDPSINVYACRYTVTTTYIPGFNYIVAIEAHSD